MRLLVDTHAFIWFSTDDKRLSTNAGEILSDRSNELLISVGSFWELAIKSRLGKLSLSTSFGEFVNEASIRVPFSLLPLEMPHIELVSQLPIHHRDPFDRMLVAQAIVERVPVLTNDAEFENYDIKIVW